MYTDRKIYCKRSHKGKDQTAWPIDNKKQVYDLPKICAKYWGEDTRLHKKEERAPSEPKYNFELFGQKLMTMRMYLHIYKALPGAKLENLASYRVGETILCLQSQ